ncbi:AMMECR1 domain-containing protein [Trichoderma camerunense]
MCFYFPALSCGWAFASPFAFASGFVVPILSLVNQVAPTDPRRLLWPLVTLFSRASSVSVSPLQPSMATVEHCVVCFEALDADLNNRKPLSLEQIQSSWAAYKASSASVTGPSEAPLNPALRRLAADGVSSSSSSSSSTSLSAAGAATPATSTSSLPDTPPTAAPLFVTWNTVDPDDDDVSLRGCIGTFESQPLSEGIHEYALISALQDTRFNPISKRELPTLQAAVTLLTDFEEADDTHDWEIGTHGIRISFLDRGRRYGATYLPDVALEQGWTKDETLFSLIRKAGWMGSRSKWQDLDVKVTRYQGKKVSLNYPEFKKWRDWVQSKQ